MVRAAQVLARAKPPAELRKRRPGAEAYLARLEDELGLRSDDNLAFLPVRTGKQDLTAIIDLKRTVGWVELTRNPAIFKLNDLQDAGIRSAHPSLPRWLKRERVLTGNARCGTRHRPPRAWLLPGRNLPANPARNPHSYRKNGTA